MNSANLIKYQKKSDSSSTVFIRFETEKWCLTRQESKKEIYAHTHTHRVDISTPGLVSDLFEETNSGKGLQVPLKTNVIVISSLLERDRSHYVVCCLLVVIDRRLPNPVLKYFFLKSDYRNLRFSAQFPCWVSFVLTSRATS